VRNPCPDGLLPQPLKILQIGFVELLQNRAGFPRSTSAASCCHNLRPKEWVLPIDILGVAFGVLGLLLPATGLIVFLPVLFDLTEGARELGEVGI
jgi:hypothetical protein